MKIFFISLLFLLSGIAAAAQFPGYYIAQPPNTGDSAIHFILEEKGRFHIFSNAHYFTGKWKPADKHKIELIFEKIDPVDVFVSRGNGRSGQVRFSGFGNKKAFVSIGAGSANSQSFRPVFREEPRCSYGNNQDIRVKREDATEVTIAINMPSGAIGDKETFLYTYQIPEAFDEIYIVVNDNAFLRQKNLTIEYRNQRYILGDLEIQKQEVNPPAVPKVLQEQVQQLKGNRISAFRKDQYVKKGVVEKITPEITRKTIQVTEDPVFNIVCPEENPFPPVLPPSSYPEK